MTTTTVASRIRFILGQARCSCGATAAQCNQDAELTPGPAGLCCYPHGGHKVDKAALAALAAEAEDGEVRTVAEVAPVQGPRRVTWTWLLDQDECWQPKGRPLVRIADMDPEWRYNTAKFLEGRAERLALSQHWAMLAFASGPLGPSGDGACDAFDAAVDSIGADPMRWLKSTPLYRALVKGLPKKRQKLARLALRAAHYSTCPQRQKPPVWSPCCQGNGFGTNGTRCQVRGCPVPAPRTCTCPPKAVQP